MRISDWSSDVCSSDLYGPGRPQQRIAVFGLKLALDVAKDETPITPDRPGKSHYHCTGSINSALIAATLRGSQALDIGTAAVIRAHRYRRDARYRLRPGTRRFALRSAPGRLPPAFPIGAD